MSNRKIDRWSTKADILEDLAEVTGTCMDVDENFIANGDDPPPVRRCDDEDDEFNLRFPGAINPYDMPVEDKGPDLEGIHKFLRMLEEDDDTPKRSVRSSPGKPTDTIITISKLNPNVPEFVPKGAIVSSPSNKKSFNVNGVNGVSDERTKEIKVDQQGSIEDIRIDKKLDLIKLNADEIKDMSLKLRNKISNVSNKDDLHTKKEKNVAIAALLKLYTAPREDFVEKKPLKLFTPEYFATQPAQKEIRCEIHDVVTKNFKASNEAEIPTIDNSDSASERSVKNLQTATSTEDDTSTQSGKSSPKSYIETPQGLDHFPHDPNVQKSIKKVTSWLQKPESPKPKGPVVCLGPISFKKKSVKSSVSGESSSRSSPSLSVTTPIAHFVPSKRAEELSKKYSERGEEIVKRSEDIWTKAMKEMKAIDKKKLEQSSSQSDSRDDDGSSVSTTR